MSIVIYNVLKREKETFTPLVDGRVHMYVCGPTVYDHAHLGHAKTYVSFDVVVRWFRYSGYHVRYVQNITDVGHMLDDGEDRILKRRAPRARGADGDGRALHALVLRGHGRARRHPARHLAARVSATSRSRSR